VKALDPRRGLRPGEFPRFHAWEALLTIRAALEPTIDRELRARCGLPFTWFDVLFQLNHVSKQRLLMHDLAAALLLSKSGLTRLVDRIEEAGLVRREANDRRSTYVAMTDAGMTAFKRAMPFVQASIRHHFAQHIHDDEIAVVETVLTRIARAAREQAFVLPSEKRPARGALGVDVVERSA
jgi:DNA-binding MarR family transcriptional regulator